MRNIVVILFAVTLAACAGEPAPETTEVRQDDLTAPSTTEAAPAVTPSASASPETTIHVGKEFSPMSVSVPKGQPIRLAFQRSGEPTCADEVVFPELNLRKKLPANQTTIVELPPSEARTLNFVCGMNMMKGTLVVQ